MKRIEAVIRHEKMEEVRNALDEAGVKGMHVIEVKGAGHQKGYTQSYRGARVQVHLRPKIKIVTVVDDSQAKRVCDVIVAHARTGEIGDGKIFISPVEECIRIRTGEAGASVL